MPTTPPPSAPRYTAASALIAASAVRAAHASQPRGNVAVAATIATYQATQAVLAERAVDQMLADQSLDVAAEALLNSPAFTSEVDRIMADLDKIANDYEFDRLVSSLVQDAGRSAQSVAIAARPKVSWVRHLTLPSCSRCAVLAGRVYRYSQGFERHENCDCTMTPVTVASPDLTYDFEALIRSGQVTGTSKADRRAIRDGADVGQVINVRLTKGGVHESGRVLYRAGRMTPEAIYRKTGDDREAALALLQSSGYLR